MDHHLHGVWPGGPKRVFGPDRRFQDVRADGNVLPAEDKNAVLLPRRIDGDWMLFHRPASTRGRDVWLSRSSDLRPGGRRSSSSPPRRWLVGRSPCGHGPAANRDGARLARRLPRCASDGRRRSVSCGAGTARTGGSLERRAALGGMGAGPGAEYEVSVRRPERRVSMRSGPQRAERQCSFCTTGLQHCIGLAPSAGGHGPVAARSWSRSRRALDAHPDADTSLQARVVLAVCHPRPLALTPSMICDSTQRRPR